MSPRLGPRAALVAAALLVARGASAQCDPSTHTTPIPVPAQARSRCGDGRATRGAVSCERRCSGGCGHPRRCVDACDHLEEPCDGGDLRGQTCQSLGFAGGALRCLRSCLGLDVSRCEPCFASDRVRCGAVSSAGGGAPSSPRIAARDGDVGLLWMTSPERPGPNVFFATRDVALGAAGAARPVTSSNLVASLAATREGYLVASYDGAAALVHRVERDRPAALAWRRAGTFQYVDLVVSADGEVALTTLDGSGQLGVHPLDARGAARPMPAAPFHGAGWFGRVMVVPVGAGEVRVEGGATLAAREGDHVAAWVRASTGRCGAASCEAQVAVLRGDARGGRAGVAGLGERLDLVVRLPDGATATLTQRDRDYDDTYTPGSPRAAASLRARGPLRLAPADDTRVWASTGVREFAFARQGEALVGVAVFAPEPAPRGGAGRLLLARVRP